MRNGVKGSLFTGPSGGSVFLPAAGFSWGESNFICVYWTSTLESEYTHIAFSTSFGSDFIFTDSGSDRSYGHTVRPVSK